MAWVLWLTIPVLTPALAATAVWLRARPARVPDAEEAMRQHQEYLEALATPARGAIRVAPRQLND